MAKKKDRNKKTPIAEKKSRKTIYWIVGAIGIIIAFLAISGNIPLSGKEVRKGKSFSVHGGETRSVLEPSLFTGQARAAYAAAKKYPEVLNQVFCYCFCDAEPFNHKTLLSCFTERHGAG